MIRPLVVGLVLAATVAGCGGTVKVQAPTSRDLALLSSIVGGMKTDLVSVQIETTSRAWAGASRHPGQMLVARSAATTTAGKVRDDWYGRIIATAYNHQCAAKADHCLAVYDGVTGGSRLGGRYAQRPFASRSALSRKIRAAFASAGLRVTSVAFEHPYALAPVVTVRTRHPQRAVYAIRKADVGMPWRHDAGSFVQMLDGHGRVFYIEAGTWSGSEGWVRPGLHVPGVP